MGNALRDALTKAGLVSTSKAKASVQQSKKATRQELHAKRTGSAKAQSDVALAAAKAEEERLARDREANRAREAAAAAKAARAQARQILREHALNDATAALAFHFVENSRVCHVYVTESQREELTKGHLSIVALGERHYLVPDSVAEKVRAIVPEVFVYRPVEDKQSHPPSDDAYAAYPVPDDLVW